MLKIIKRCFSCEMDHRIQKRMKVKEQELGKSFIQSLTEPSKPFFCHSCHYVVSYMHNDEGKWTEDRMTIHQAKGLA